MYPPFRHRRRMQYPICFQCRDERLPCHRSKCPLEPFFGVGFQGHRLSVGLCGGQDCLGIYVGSDRRDGHAQLSIRGSFVGLPDLQDTTLGLDEIRGRVASHRFEHEIGRRNHVHRPFVRRDYPERFAYDRPGDARFCGQ